MVSKSGPSESGPRLSSDARACPRSVAEHGVRPPARGPRALPGPCARVAASRPAIDRARILALLSPNPALSTRLAPANHRRAEPAPADGRYAARASRVLDTPGQAVPDRLSRARHLQERARRASRSTDLRRGQAGAVRSGRGSAAPALPPTGYRPPPSGSRLGSRPQRAEVPDRDRNGANRRQLHLLTALSTRFDEAPQALNALTQAADANRHIQTAYDKGKESKGRPMSVWRSPLRMAGQGPASDMDGRRREAKGLIRTG